MPHLQVSQIYQKTWNAIHAKNEDGTRKYRYIIHKGSSRSSKTYSLIDCYDTYARSEDNKRMTVWRNTKVDCKKTVLNDTIKHLKKTGRYGVAQIFNKTESIFTYATDSTFEIHGTEDVDTVMGLTQDVAWLNEPYQISREIFDQIDQRTSDFILVDLNPKKAHWVDDLEKDSRAIVIHSTFRDNPFVPIEQKRKILSYQPISWCDLVIKDLLKEDEARNYSIEKNELDFTPKQLRELDRCRENEYKNSADSYNWCVFGLGLKAERPNRIFKFNVIPDQQFFDLDVTTYYGVDWGASHPWAVIAVKYYDGALYLHELNYTPENVIRAKLTPTEREQIQTGEEGLVMYYFKKFGIAKGATIVCDPNRKEKIAALRTIGYTNAVPAAKPPGSVNFGIDTIKNIPVFFTKSSANIDFEQENYSYIVDSYGVTTEDPEDLDNHCFVGETMITTTHGQKRIKYIQKGDSVLTSSGYKEVSIKWDNGIQTVNDYIIYFKSNFKSISATSNHLLKANGKWVKISELKSGMKLYTAENKSEMIEEIVILNSRQEFVYDITVRGKHEYFANDILVHNCMDALRYVVSQLRRLGIIKKI